VVVAFGLFLAVATAGVAAAVAGGSDRVPQSCKPLAPVAITLESEAANATWRIAVTATAPAAAVIVSLRDDAGMERVVWQGALAGGERRDFVVRHAPPTRATALRAEVAVRETAQFTSRAAAAVALAAGKPVALAAAGAAAGRHVVDAQRGETVLELPGEGGKP
jgi:hypothetical protein